MWLWTNRKSVLKGSPSKAKDKCFSNSSLKLWLFPFPYSTILLAKLVCKGDNLTVFIPVLTSGPSELCIPSLTNTSYVVLVSCSARGRGVRTEPGLMLSALKHLKSHDLISPPPYKHNPNSAFHTWLTLCHPHGVASTGHHPPAFLPDSSTHPPQAPPSTSVRGQQS